MTEDTITRLMADKELTLACKAAFLLVMEKGRAEYGDVMKKCADKPYEVSQAFAILRRKGYLKFDGERWEVAE